MLVLLFLLLSLPSAAAPVRVVFDPRVETVEILHLLSGVELEPPRILDNRLAYAREVRARFEKHRGHPAVSAYRRAVAAGANAPELFDAAANGYHASVGKDTEAVAALMEALPAFERDTYAAAFYAEQRGRYQDWESRARARAAALDVAGLFEEYSGLKATATVTVYLCPFLERTTSIENCDLEGCWVRSFWGPEKPGRGEPDFAFDRRPVVLWHELAHLALDRLADRDAALIEARRPPQGVKDCYWSWDRCVREHVAQGAANAILGRARRDGKVSRGQPIEGNHLFKLRAVERRLRREYEADRARYRSLEEFYPRLLDVF